MSWIKTELQIFYVLIFLIKNVRSNLTLSILKWERRKIKKGFYVRGSSEISSDSCYALSSQKPFRENQRCSELKHPQNLL